MLHIYLSPEHVGKSTETLASWGVDDIERVVGELTKRGVTFEQYDEPGLRTDERGIATFEGDAKVAYFKDPDGHTLDYLGAAQPPEPLARALIRPTYKVDSANFALTQF